MRRLMLENVLGNNTYEIHEFTISQDGIRSYDVEHTLGRVPKFAIVYPIDVPVLKEKLAHKTWMIILTNQLGQKEYNLKPNGSVDYSTSNSIGITLGTGYCNGYNIEMQKADLAVSNPGVVFGETVMRVGNITHLGWGGVFVMGKYGVIIG